MRAVAIILLLALLVTSETAIHRFAHREQSITFRAKTAIVSSLGLATMSISPECSATGDMTEGICGCLGDLPGGYCYHTACDVVSLPAPVSDGLLSLSIRKSR